MDIREIENKEMRRSAVIKRDAINEEERTVEIAFSSDVPYRRWFGDEILSHEKGAVDLNFLGSGRAPLLADHDHTDVIGVIEKAWIDKDRKGRALVRFGKSVRAEEFFQDVVDGIRTNISVGYTVKKWEVDEEPETPVYTAVKWSPMENSIVSVPADTTVGVGRSVGKEEIIKEPKKMAENIEVVEERKPEVNIEQITRDAQAKEVARIQEITAIGEKRGFKDEAAQFIKENKSVSMFREFVWDQEEKNAKKSVTEVVENKDIGLTEKEAKDYSFMRMLRAQLDPRQFSKDAAFEIECSKAAAEKSGTAPRGLIVPTDVLKRDLSVGTATAGGHLVATDLLSGSFIDVLRNLSVVMGMGATTLTDLDGNIAIPRKTSGSSAGWLATEGGDAAQSEPAFDQVTMNPKTLGVYGEATRQLLMQSSIDVENMLRSDLAAGMATAIDLASLYGTGSSGQPTGVSVQTGINAPTAFAAAVPTYAEVVAMESAVAVDNALVGTLGYIVEPAMRGSLKTAEKFSGTGQQVWEPGGTLNGYKTGVTNQITSGDVFFGNWADLLIGMWGGLDILVDPYTNSLSGTVRIVCHQSMDIAVRHPVSFAFNNDGA